MDLTIERGMSTTTEGDAPKKKRARQGFGARLKDRRVELGYTQEELAKKVERSKGAVAHWENELTEPGFEVTAALAYALDCEVSWLAFGEGGANSITITGVIGAGGVAREAKVPRQVPLPPFVRDKGINVQAFRVESDALAPRIASGDLIYVWSEPQADWQKSIGKEALVTLADGRQLLRRVDYSEMEGCVTLTDGRGSVIRDIRPKAVQPIIAIVPEDQIDQYRATAIRQSMPGAIPN